MSDQSKVIHQSDLLPGIIKPRHIGDNCQVIQFGLAADIPDGSTWIKAYFATDTDELSLWNGNSWVSVTLS